MKAVIQRVARASVTVDGNRISSIGKGYLILLGIDERDTQRDIETVAAKVAKLRIFADQTDIGGEILLVSQFTLCAQTRHGNRPAFIRAKNPTDADAMYRSFGARLASAGIPVQYGQFGAMMDVELVNDGPVTIIIESIDGTIVD